MKHVKLIVALLLFVALVVNVTFAAGPQTAGRLQLPQGQVQQSEAKVAKASRTQLQAPVFEPVESGSSFDKTSEQPVVLTKSGSVPPGFQISGLAPTYHIGAAQTFKTIADIALLCNIGALTGPVTFLLDDPAYTEAGVAIGATVGSSATNTITVRPNTGNTACVITLTDNTTNKGGLVLDGATNFIIEGTALGSAAGSRNLTIQLSATPSAANGGDAPVYLKNAKYATVTDCVIPGNTASTAMSATADNTTNGNGSVTTRSTAGNYSSFITVNNCDLSGGHFGVVSRGNFLISSATYGAQDDDFTVTNNYIHDVTRAGIDLRSVSIANISKNTVKRVVLASSAGASPALGFGAGVGFPITSGGNPYNIPLANRVAGISVWGDGIHISQNLCDSIISNRSSAGTGSGMIFGIRVIAFGNNDPDPSYGGALSMAGIPSRNVIKNNIVTRVFNNSAVQANGLRWANVGIGMESGRFDTVYFNTVYFSGAGLGNQTPCAALLLNGVATTTDNNGLNNNWRGAGGTLINAFSYRTKVSDNILAINRTNTGTDNTCIAMQDAGGVVDYRGGNNNVLYNGSIGNVSDVSGGAVNPSLFDHQQFQIGVGFATDGASQADDPVLTSQSNVTFSGLSTANGTGVAVGSVPGDYNDSLRGSPPDIGALEGTGTSLPHDVKPVVIVSPGIAGAPAGLPFSPVQITFSNLGGFLETSFPVNVKIVNPDASIQNMPGTATLAAGAAATVTIPGSWNPGSLGGTATFTVTTNLGTDNYHFNDTIIATFPVAAQATVPYFSGFETAPEQAGWFAGTQWGIGTTGGKLGGPHAGTKYFATAPGAPASGTRDAEVENLFSPFFDFSSSPSPATMSFYLSLQTEPGWDRAIMEYSIDTGKTWQKLGVLNDPAGINWYSSAVYQNAHTTGGTLEPLPNCWDEATAVPKGFPGDGSGANPPDGWSSNGDCGGNEIVTGPTGYVIVALDLSGTPVMGKSYVRFRLSYFTDAGTHGDGVAIDDFKIGAPPVPNPAGYSGKVYNDVNGNGIFDGPDVGLAGLTVHLNYFGGSQQTTVSLANGDYSFVAPNAMNLPGDYDVSTTYAGGALFEHHVSTYSGSGTAITGVNLGYFTGSISGMKFNDINDNGVNDTDPGLAGWTIEVHKDSLAGALVSSAVTDGSGNYSFKLIPGTYVLREIAQPTVGRRTFPAGAGTHTVVVAQPGNTPTSVITGQDFGNWLFAKIRVNLTIDINGDGTVNPGDVLPLPSIAGTFSTFKFKKNGVTLLTDTLGNGVASREHSSLDTGTYTIAESTFTPGWVRTKGGVFTKIVTASGASDTARYLDFKLITVTGRKYNDLNGNGVDDSDPGLAGWTITVSGTVNGSASAVTDSLGNYSIDSVFTGLHTITETPQAGWTMTFPTTPYSFTAVSGNLANPVTARDFGNFHNYSISGQKYRDRNNDGTKDAGDNGLSGWTINLNPGALTQPTDANGNYTFTNVGPGVKTLSETAQLGWTQSAPVGGTYTINGVSGTNVTGRDFGNFQANDSTAYRTFTAAQLQADNQKKPIKAPKAGKPITAGPNTGNLVAEVLKQGGVIKVGLAAQTNAGGKEKAYIQPVKQGDLWKSLNAKSVFHTGAARGLDLDVKGKILLKRFKALPPTKKNSTIIANLLALQVNLAASGLKTPAGLGSLMYNDAGNPMNGWSVDSIANYADGVMTNWEGVPYDVYVMIDSVAAKINAAFSYGGTNDTTTGGGWTSPKLQWKGYTVVIDVPYLKASGIPAQNRIAPPVIEQIPTEFALSQNYPNPFNPTTTIRFDLAQQSVVTLKIYNMLGQEVAQLLNREDMSAGTEELEFDASSLASGVYLYRIVAESVNDNGAVSQTYTQVKKMVLLK